MQDLEEIHDFIADDNARAALRFISLLEKKCESIARIPAMGRRREELAPGLRGLPVKKYVIFYRQNKGRVEIIRFLHGARDIISLFEKERKTIEELTLLEKNHRADGLSFEGWKTYFSVFSGKKTGMILLAVSLRPSRASIKM